MWYIKSSALRVGGPREGHSDRKPLAALLVLPLDREGLGEAYFDFELPAALSVIPIEGNAKGGNLDRKKPWYAVYHVTLFVRTGHIL